MSAQIGDRVRIRYTHMHDAREHDPRSSQPRVLEFIIGSDHVLPGLSQFVIGMQPGEQKCVALPPAQAYGEVQSRLIRKISRRSLHTKRSPRMGMLLTPKSSDFMRGHKVRIVKLNARSVLVDGNHPRAGRQANLAVYIVSVDSSSETNSSKPQFDLGGEA
ncbi:FKBP-type peptidyl-prolyl cis-trans isomerase [Anatilimnocola floriformis]|uniref:FKBP-type peptidyl-prolyl cis-trans isomerase n=1 Tax=Anatilimnocola floriformis TaxID=2948575 RepID=UPI0020C2D185|nr:FKBP-type peptidyl-prolyl cis-trans isomerase [Anatilimnocola floriformis]